MQIGIAETTTWMQAMLRIRLKRGDRILIGFVNSDIPAVLEEACVRKIWQM